MSGLLLGTFAGLIALSAGCPMAKVGPPGTGPAPLCDSAHLASCEEALWLRLDAPSTAEEQQKTVAAWDSYMAARQLRDREDGWSQLSEAVRRAVKDPGARRAVVLAEKGAAPATNSGAAAAQVPVVELPVLPKLKSLSIEQALLLLGEAADLRLMVRSDRSGAVWELYPSDPLRPFMAGVLAVARDDAALSRLAGEVRQAELIATAFQQAGATLYNDAAATADQLTALMASETGSREPTLRARYALQLLGSAALVLEKPESETKTPAPASAPDPITPADTPYGDLLRVRSAKNSATEWPRRRANILRAVAADRRDDLAELFSGRRACESGRRPPAISGVRDLIFAYSVAGALARARDGSIVDGIAAPGSRAATGEKGDGKGGARISADKLPLPLWQKEYAAVLRLVEATGTAWWYLPALLSERAVPAGEVALQTPEYGRVTALGVRHLLASVRLQQSVPLRYPLAAELGLLLSPGAATDPELAGLMVSLVEQTVRGKLNPAATPAALLEVIWTAALTGLSLPAGVRDAHFRGLIGQVRELLQGPMQKQVGWSVALLYSLDELYRLFAHEKPAVDENSAQVVRALDGRDVAYPELARLLQATVQYLVAALRDPGALSTEYSGAAARFGTLRRDALDSLRAALLGLRPAGGSEAPPAPALVEETALFIDALVAVIATSAREPGADKSSACGASDFKRSAAPQAALAQLRSLRAHLLAQRAIKEGDGTWARRARLLVLLLSDGMDFALRDAQPVQLTFAAVAAEQAVAEGLEAFVGPLAAAPLALIYASGRQMLAEVIGRPGAKLSSTAELQRLMRGAMMLLQATSSGADAPLLAALRGVDLAAAVGARDEAQLLSKIAGQLYAHDKRNQADALLLVATTILSIRQLALPKELMELARAQHSQLLGLFALLSALHPTAPHDREALAVLRTEAQRACLTEDADEVLAISAAIRSYRDEPGKRARQALAAALRQAQQLGLHVPHAQARYEDQSGRRFLQANVEQTLAAGLIRGGTFQFGLGMRTLADLNSKMELKVFEPASATVEKEAMRAFIQAAARLLIYDLLDRDPTAAEEAAGWLVSALRHGLRLGAQGDGSEQQLLQDGLGAVAVAAQLAAESGMVQVASALWSSILGELSSDVTDARLTGYLEPPPFGLAQISALAPVIARAAASLRALAPLVSQCVARAAAAAPQVAAAQCADASAQTALHLASSKLPLPSLPANCPQLAAIWPALAEGSGESQVVRAAQSLVSTRQPQEAALWLLSNQSRCGASCVPLERQLGRASLPVLLRAELLRMAASQVGLAEGASGPDLLTWAELSTQQPQLRVSLSIMRVLIVRALLRKDLSELEALAGQPGFLSRWQQRVGSTRDEYAAALLLSWVVAAQRGEPSALARDDGHYRLLCALVPAAKLPEGSLRRGLCSELQSWRALDRTLSPAARTAKATETLSRLEPWLEQLANR